jgi:hypothetical protein
MSKFDLLYFGTDETIQQLFQFFTFGYNRIVGVRGPQKLALQWLKCFMTTKGSDPTRLGYGTEYSNLFGSNIGNIQDVRDVVMLNIQDCNEQIAAIQLESMPDLDEQLGSASLIQFTPVGADGFDAYIRIMNAAQQEITVQLPTIATSLGM